MIKKIKFIWDHKYNIIKGFTNLFLNKNKKVKEERLSICRTNTCGFYDPNGESANAYFPGKESCGVCGCYLKALCSDLDSICSLHEINKEPLWKNTDI